MVLAPYAYSLLRLMVTEDGYQSLNKSRKMRNKWLPRRTGAICGDRRGTRSPAKTLCTMGSPVPAYSRGRKSHYGRG
ncbi:hypothetical protein AGR2A_Cc70023 [Agrobacterium genomosp. 2 str. CFBP 5494]|uniref:Uncharacterized protein n=1 Tax=Agrobacterium genomosp. 2 str. CFBP 5494 TaxID=1183436 RepID=A0A9W5B2M6_9HYPH|nr:hypothetical protein AGR2A_Cc70023 [Agrobacterium genomosp. 2 str. CFBP 5494]